MRYIIPSEGDKDTARQFGLDPSWLIVPPILALVRAHRHCLRSQDRDRELIRAYRILAPDIDPYTAVHKADRQRAQTTWWRSVFGNVRRAEIDAGVEPPPEPVRRAANRPSRFLHAAPREERWV